MMGRLSYTIGPKIHCQIMRWDRSQIIRKGLDGREGGMLSYTVGPKVHCQNEMGQIANNRTTSAVTTMAFPLAIFKWSTFSVSKLFVLSE